MTTSVDVSPSTTPCGTPLSGAPKYGTVIPNRIFVGGIAANTTELELKQFFSAYGAVKDSKIIADRAGVSKGYGFITFENQEDADRIIKKESDNLVFRDRKLNIGPAIRKQQVLPRTFESPVSPGAIMFSNGVPYTYQNGMAVFASPEGTSYTVPQAQPQTALVVPQTPPMYVQPQYAYQTSPQWAPAVSAAAASHWRYMTQSPTQALTAATAASFQSPTQALTAAAAANPYMIMQPELMYTPQYQPTELPDAAMMEGATVAATGVEGALFQGSILPVQAGLQPAVSQPASQHSSTTYAIDGSNAGVTSAVVADSQQLQFPQSMQSLLPLGQSVSVPSTSATANHLVQQQSVSSVPKTQSHANIAPYKKPITTLARRAYPSQTFLVRNGHKVQCVMMPPAPKVLSTGQVTIMARPPDGTLSPPPSMGR